MPLLADDQVVPVLMFHSVGLRRHPWVWNHLSEPLVRFERFLAWLRRHGFITIDLAALQAHMRGEQTAPRNSIVLTFDDGYLDNWVYAAPLLRKYGMSGTVFVTTDFVQPGAAPRPTIESVWEGRSAMADLQPAGFMNWEELRRLALQGPLDVQSHGLTHTWWFSEPNIVGWHTGIGFSPWPWLAWNARPDRKPWYLTEDQNSYVRPGYPIFAHRQALVTRRFIPDPDAVDTLQSHVEGKGGSAYFSQQHAVSTLRSIAGSISSSGRFPGTYEAAAERERRVRCEIGDSKRRLEAAIGKRIEYICWPAGGSDDFCEKVAVEFGYMGWTLRSGQQAFKRNKPGEDPHGIRRMSGQRGIYVGGHRIGEGGTAYQALQIEAHRNSLIASALLRSYKLAALASNRFTRVLKPGSQRAATHADELHESTYS